MHKLMESLDIFDDIKNSFNHTFKLFAPELQLGFLKFLKGTPMRQKINELQNMEGKMQSAILSKYPCTIFEYELEGKIKVEHGKIIVI